MSKILAAQDHIVSLLLADPYFSGAADGKPVMVLSERKGVVDFEIQQRFLELGLGVLVMCKSFAGTADFIESAVKTIFAVVATEDPTINRLTSGTGKMVEDVIERVIPLIQNQPQSAAVNPRAKHARFQLDEKGGYRIDPPKEKPGLVTWVVSFRTDIILLAAQ